MTDSLYFRDSYGHMSKDIEYLPESLKCVEVERSCEYYEFIGCSCSSYCIPEVCTCLKRSGAYYSFINREELESYFIKELSPSKPMYECNKNCQCSNYLCGNRLVQCGPRRNLTIAEQDGKGLSLFTTKSIKSGNFLCEYAGIIITPEMARTLYLEYKAKYSMNFIFCIREQFGNNIYKTIIDPTESGNIGRYINHSCEPNCKLYIIRVNDATPKLCIFASENIPENEEICFNYGDQILCSKSSKGGVTCLCRKARCKNFLPFDETCFE